MALVTATHYSFINLDLKKGVGTDTKPLVLLTQSFGDLLYRIVPKTLYQYKTSDSSITTPNVFICDASSGEALFPVKEGQVWALIYDKLTDAEKKKVQQAQTYGYAVGVSFGTAGLAADDNLSFDFETTPVLLKQCNDFMKNL